MSTINKLISVTATEIVKPANSGRTKPLIARCNLGDPDTPTKDFLVKLRFDKNMADSGLGFEAIASLLAQHFDINLPPPALVNILPELAQALAGTALGIRIKQNIGLNFGLEYLKTTQPYSPLSNNQLDIAISAFAFDMLIQNLDRRIENPNILVFNGVLNFIDHEMAFAFTDPLNKTLGISNDPCDFSGCNPKKHVFYQYLRKHDCNFEPFIQRLETLTDALISAIIGDVPGAWRTPRVLLIEDHLKMARDNSKLFKRKLQETVS